MNWLYSLMIGALCLSASHNCVQSEPLIRVFRGGQATAPAKGAIIFIHGLGGDRSSFKAPNARYDWLELAYRDTRQLASGGKVADHDIFLFEYPAKKDDAQDLATVAKSFSTSLTSSVAVSQTDTRTMDQYDHIIIVGHSLGGLVALAGIEDLFYKYSVAPAATRSDNPLLKIRGVFLLGTPALGSDLADTILLNVFIEAYNRSGDGSISLELARELSRSGKTRRLVIERWGAILAFLRRENTRGFPLLFCLDEGQKTNLKIYSDYIVTPDKTAQDCTVKKTINADHFQLARPVRTEEDEVYSVFWDGINKMLAPPRVAAAAASADPGPTQFVFRRTSEQACMDANSAYTLLKLNKSVTRTASAGTSVTTSWNAAFLNIQQQPQFADLRVNARSSSVLEGSGIFPGGDEFAFLVYLDGSASSGTWERTSKANKTSCKGSLVLVP